MQSKINVNSSGFKESHQTFYKALSKLQKELKKNLHPETTEDLNKLKNKGKLTASARIEAIIDTGAPILEIAPLCAPGIRVAISKVHAKDVLIIANNPVVKGGTYLPETVKKHLRGQEIASNCDIPCIYLVDSGGAFLPKQKDIFPDRFHFGRIFFNQAQMSGNGIPQISVVLGSCTAGGAYIPAMSDQTIMVEKNATVFLGGPPLVKAATGETVDAETLGGAEMHCSESGVSDYLARDEAHAFEICRNLIKELPSKSTPSENFSPPTFSPDELYGIIGHIDTEFVDAHEILLRLTDSSDYNEFKPLFGKTLLCARAKIKGKAVGIIANNGVLFGDSALKGAHFIQLCDQQNIPLLFIHNVMGFMVGTEFEKAGIAKHGAKLVKAVSCANVPKVSLIAGGSYGAGNYAMCGRAFDPDFLFSWPGSHISVMGGKQAANVLSQIKFKNQNSAEAKKLRKEIEDRYEKESNAFFASAQLWDDGIIDPVETRNVIGYALELVKKRNSPGNYGVLRF